VGVYDNDSFNPEIRVSGDFAQTNNCPATLSAPAAQIQGCLITVTFSPTRSGPREGILSTGTGGPTAELTGNGGRHRTPRPGFRLSGDKTQNPQEDGPIRDMGACNLHVNMSCGVNPCTARATGRLTKIKENKLTPEETWTDVMPGETVNIGPELTKDSQRRAVRRALNKGRTSRRRSPSARRIRPAR
jgi:hypothetical protein